MLIQPNSRVQGNYYIPRVIEQTRNGEIGYDIYSRLLKDRIIWLGSEVRDDNSNEISAKLLLASSTSMPTIRSSTGSSGTPTPLTRQDLELCTELTPRSGRSAR